MIKKYLVKTCVVFLLISVHFGKIVCSEYREIQCELKPFKRSSLKKDHLNVASKREKFSINPMEFGRSSNWCGYSTLTSLVRPRNGSVRAVNGSWIVPRLSVESKRRYCAIWVGIDGYWSSTVEQIGTEHDMINGRQVNYAWFEMFPRQAFFITNFPVRVGDRISASVVYEGNNVFKLTIINHTTRLFTTIPRRYTTMQAARSSAEWILETPSLNNRLLPLANFGLSRFYGCSAIINNIRGPINRSGLAYDRIIMVTAQNQPKAVPTKLSLNGHRFNIVWRHA